MTNQYADTSTADLERADSAEGADLQEQDKEQPQQPGIDLGDFIDDRLRRQLDFVNRRLQSLDDRTTRTLETLGGRIEALAASGASLSDIRDMVDDLHALSVDPNDREKRKLERQIATLERDKQAPPRTEPAQPAASGERQFNEAEFSAEWGSPDAPVKGTVLGDAFKYAALRGNIDADTFRANLNRLQAEAAPQGVYYGPSGLRAFRAAMEERIDAWVEQRRATTRPQTRTPNVQTNGAGGPAINWEQAQKKASLGQLSEAEYQALLARG